MGYTKNFCPRDLYFNFKAREPGQLPLLPPLASSLNKKHRHTQRRLKMERGHYVFCSVKLEINDLFLCSSRQNSRYFSKQILITKGVQSASLYSRYRTHTKLFTKIREFVALFFCVKNILTDNHYSQNTTPKPQRLKFMIMTFFPERYF